MSLSFIETQFPVSRLSKESYKERKSNYSQTLTGLGKWWGRKPLILCRATILGLLLPATDNPEADRACFLALLTLDEDGLLRRFKGFQAKELLELATLDEAAEYETKRAASVSLEASPMEKVLLKAEFQDFRAALERRIFLRLPYDQQIAFCHRPENIDGPSPEAWEKINAHLGTAASTIPELVRELGQRRFGRVPRVGDAFCGGGSIPFEAARIGCEAHASDLSPVAALLTWAALNIVGGGPEVAKKVRAAQAEIYAAVDAQVTAWGIEHKTEDLQPGEWEKLTAALAVGTLTPADIATRVWRADAYLYCVEVRCPETGWLVPLAPTWMVGEASRTIATLVPLPEEKRYRIDIKSAASPAEIKAAKLGTIRKGLIVHPVLENPEIDPDLVPPGTEESFSLDPASIESVRTAGRGQDAALHHANGLRLWENDDLVPRPDDVFQERLYCVRWIETRIDKKSGKRRTTKHYRSITAHDLAREQLAAITGSRDMKKLKAIANENRRS